MPPAPTAPKKKGHAGFVVLGVLVAVGIVASIFSDKTDTVAPTKDTGVSSGFGTQDASGDVSWGAKGFTVDYGIVTAPIVVTNHTDGMSDYYIEVGVENAAGDRIGWGNAVVSHLAPGQTARVNATATVDGPANSADSLVFTEIQRTAST